MTSANQPNLHDVDWSKIPAPPDDGAADHLKGARVAPVALLATDGSSITLADVPGRIVVFAYPRTGEPGKISLVDDWDMIPGARGCTPQTCSFRDLAGELKAAGATRVFGLSTQDTAYQREAAEGRVVVVGYRGPDDLLTTSIPMHHAGIADGTTLTDSLSGQSFTVQNGALELRELERGSTLVLEE